MRVHADEQVCGLPVTIPYQSDRRLSSSAYAIATGGELTAWQKYLRWNSAVCRWVFSEDLAGRPAYLDMDESVLGAIAESLGVAREDARSHFLDAVRSTVDLRAPREDVFEVHVRQLAAWRRRVRESRGQSRVEPPPSVGLLAAFTLAAEAMGSDSTVAAHAYYPRLAAVLGATGEQEKERLVGAYQATAEPLWRSLNDWLALSDGRFGVPTAYALTHRYVGLPLSQALIRDGDRRRLVQMFQRFGLPPGSVMTPGDMERVIDTWMAQSPCPASKNFQGLWQRAGARERISEVATAELAAWDYLLDDADGVDGQPLRAGSVQLVAQFKRFPRSSMHLSFLASLPGARDLEQLRVLSAEGGPLLEVLGVGAGQFRPRSSDDLDVTSLAEGVLTVGDLEGQLEAKRYPRRVVPMRKDEASNTYVECERVQLGEDFAVLVKNEGDLVDRVIAVLDGAARPGFSVRAAMGGLPAGWSLVTGVQLLTTPPASATRPVELNALAPLVKSHLSVAGGLKLPGSLRKWSTLRPPEIRAVSQLGGDLTLALSRVDATTGEDTAEQVWTSSNGAILVDLADEGLDDGDYELRLSGEGEALQRFLLRLRSSDTPDGWTWASAPALRYDLRAPWAALTAAPADELPAPIEVTSRRDPLEPARQPIGKIWWKSPGPQTRQPAPIVIAAPEPGSCVVTGAHYIVVPTLMPNLPEPPFQVGECRQCGLTRRYPTRYKKGKSKRFWEESHVDLSSRPEVARVKDDAVGPDDALDALVHVGGGTASSLERVLAHVNSSALEVDGLRRSLEALGHIEIRRDSRLDIVGWQIAPPQLLETASGSFFVAGGWSRGAVGELQSAVEARDGVLAYFDEQAGGLTSWYVEGLAAEVLESMLPALAEHLPMGTAPIVVRDAAAQLVAALPPLSAVAATLPRVQLPGAQKISRLDLETASWLPVQSAVTAGAYRMESGFRSQYLFRSSEDVDRGEAVVCSVQLAKHLEAQRAGRPLLGHFPSGDQLVVPLGADLPVLYGRAAVLCSGRLPTDLPKKYTTIYHEVPREIAVTLHTVLSS